MEQFIPFICSALCGLLCLVLSIVLIYTLFIKTKSSSVTNDLSSPNKSDESASPTSQEDDIAEGIIDNESDDAAIGSSEAVEGNPNPSDSDTSQAADDAQDDGIDADQVDGVVPGSDPASSKDTKDQSSDKQDSTNKPVKKKIKKPTKSDESKGPPDLEPPATAGDQDAPDSSATVVMSIPIRDLESEASDED